jgi:hypothetical protein
MTIDPEVADAPIGLPYQHYWDDEEYKAGLHAEIVEAIEYARERGETTKDYLLADHIMDRVFKRVKLHTWCARVSCGGHCSGPTHYAFDITTHPRRFADGDVE